MKKVLSVIVLMGLSVQAVSAQDLISRAQKTSQSLSQWPQRVVRVVKKKYFDKTPLTLAEQALLNKLSIGALTAITAALAATGGYLVSRSDSEEEMEISPSSGTSATNVGDILKKFNVRLGQDDSPQALFVKATSNGAGWMVDDLSDLVSRNVLQASQEIATQKALTQPSIYVPIQQTINRALTQFNESRLRRNLGFIRNALSELINEVKKTICTVSPNAIKEAIAQLERKPNKRKVDIEMMKILKAGCN